MMALRREKVGVLGGTFDPIHKGHLAVARAARAERGLSRVILVPAATPPHKRDDLTPASDRMAMASIAAAGEPGLEASDLELRRGGISFTVDTLEELSRALPDSELYFIIGEDSIGELHLWRDLPRIFALARLVAVNRPGAQQSFSPRLFPGISPQALQRCESDRVWMEPVDIASREVRRAIRSGEPFDELLPPGVADHIRRRHLYGYRDH